MKNFSFSGERGALSWGKNEGIERERDVLGGDERRTEREKAAHTTLHHLIDIGKSDINLYWSAGEAI